MCCAIYTEFLIKILRVWVHISVRISSYLYIQIARVPGARASGQALPHLSYSRGVQAPVRCSYTRSGLWTLELVSLLLVTIIFNNFNFHGFLLAK